VRIASSSGEMLRHVRPRLTGLLLVAAVSACGGGTEPTPPSTVPTGLWNATISGLKQPINSQLVTCETAWVMSIQAFDNSGTTYNTTIPLNVSLHCAGGVNQTWMEIGRFFAISQSGDSLLFLRPNGDTLVRAIMTGNSLSGTFTEEFGQPANFRATRRSGPDPNLAPASLIVGGQYSDLEVADSLRISALASDAYDTPVTVTAQWSSSNPGIATITNDGVVHGVSPGVVTMTGTVDTLRAQVALSVLAPPAVVAITLAPDSIIAPLTGEVTAQARDGSGQILNGRRFHWTSSNPSIATVTEYDETTTVTPVGAGTVTIAASSSAASAHVDVRILPAVSQIVISGSDGRVTLGDTVHLSAVTRDAAGNVLTGRPVSWSTSSDDGLPVGADGAAIALRSGPAIITASAGQASDSLMLQALFDASLTTVTAGDGHTCGLSAAGSVYCWGHNDEGRLGPGNPGGGAPLRVPTPVTFTSLEAGGFHTCGLTASGSAWCWGRNTSGQLGQAGGNPGDVLQVSGGVSFNRIEPGGGETCGLTASQAIWCWGANDVGQLGRGSSDAGVNPAPGLVIGGHQFTTVHVGSGYACGITTAAEAWCWGTNSFGQLGLGNTDGLPHGTPVHTAPALTFTALALGEIRACGASSDGTVWCWGNDQLTPTQVPGLSDIVAITAGFEHFCGITSAGGMTCWGTDNSYLNLSYRPSIPIARITAGLLHTCALPVSGKAICWGLNDGGQLGVVSDTLGPVEVAGQP
jgi:alpha-tubulin suppressor-like RCC1 family protein